MILRKFSNDGAISVPKAVSCADGFAPKMKDVRRTVSDKMIRGVSRPIPVVTH